MTMGVGTGAAQADASGAVQQAAVVPVVSSNVASRAVWPSLAAYIGTVCPRGLSWP